MSGLANGRSKVVGLTAAAAMALATVAGSGAASAAERPDPSKVRSTSPTATGGVTSQVAAAEEIPSECTVKSFAPTKIVLGATKVTKTFSVAVEGCTPALWSVVLWPFYDDAPLSTAGIAGNYWYWDQNADGEDVKVQLNPTISVSPAKISNSYAGRLTGAAFAKAWGQEDLDKEAADENVVVDGAWADLDLTLQRRATFGSTFNASPEPVKKGKKITLRATLARINWNGAKTLKYVGFAGKAQVQFKAAGATTYTTVKTVKATSKGKVSTTVTAGKTGSWRLYFAGLSTTAPATSTGDTVKVN